MPQIAYVNGAYVPLRDAEVSIEDRGYQFADGVYEVALVINGHYLDLDGHLARLQRSLRELRIDEPMALQSLKVIMREVLRRNRLTDALVYMQVTRGVARRNHFFPAPETPPALVLTARRFNLSQSDAKASKGIGVITQPDIRWGRVDIKTVGLLPNVLARQAAEEAGAGEAWLVRDGKVTEASASNAWLVDGEGRLVTHPKGTEILGGITRETAIGCAEELQIAVIERPFSVAEAMAAREAFVTSATGLVMPVVKIDGKPVGDGKPGPVTLRLREAYKVAVAKS